MTYESVKRNVLHAILKMKQRLVSERQKMKLLLEKQKAIQQDSTLPPLTATEKSKLEKLGKIDTTLRGSIQRMASIYMTVEFYYTE